MNPLIPALVGAVINAIQSAPENRQDMQLPALRSLPIEAKRAEMQPPHEGVVMINGKQLSLSPASQIRNTQNLIVMPSTVREPVLVKYVTDSNGNVHRVWILSPDEAARPDPKR
jgi:hypothetical protein